MAGILNNKQRIMDTIVTQEGKRQLASGQFQIKFASFTDTCAFYEGDIVSGSSDATQRIYFEAASRYQDSIVFEADDSGNMLAFQGGGPSLASNGMIMSGSSGDLSPISASAFSSMANTLSNASLNNFSDQNLISTSLRDDDSFSLNIDSGKFYITGDTADETQGGEAGVSVDIVEPFILDKRLSRIPNFKFMPPVNYGTGTPAGDFADINENHHLEFSEALKALKTKQHLDVKFEKTSQENNILLQMFEADSDENIFKKLDIIDFGSYMHNNENIRALFAGKVFLDNFSQPTFINIFTILLRN